MAKEIDLNNLKKADLLFIRQVVLQSKSREDLLINIETALQKHDEKARRKQRAKEKNELISVDFLTIDPSYKEALKSYGILNLAQLIEQDDLGLIPGLYTTGVEQVSWARDFFNMESLMDMSCETPEEQKKVVEKIVQDAKKYPLSNSKPKVYIKTDQNK